MKHFLLLSLCFLSFLCAEEAPLIESILLTENESFEEIENGNSVDIRIPVNNARLQERLQSYLGRPLTGESLIEIKRCISDCLAKGNDSLYLVEIPPQKVRNGRVTIIVSPGRVQSVTVTGNKWYSSETIKKSLGIHPGETVTESEILNAAEWINQSPFISTNIVLTPGNERGQTNINVLTKDRLPIRFYAGSDNTGSSVSGNERFFVGTTAAIGLRTLFTYQFTFGDDFPEYLAHYGNWTHFLPWEHTLVFYGGYAIIHPEITDFDSKGDDLQGSMRYKIPLKPLYTTSLHQFSFGGDFKRTDSALFFLGAFSDGTIEKTEINQKKADLLQCYVGYEYEREWPTVRVTFQWDNLFSDFKALPHQKKSDYDSLRPGANVRYYYTRMGLGANCGLPWGLSTFTLLRGQISSGALLPSEQYGLGGFSTVRGYQERVYLADNAVIGNFELHSVPGGLVSHSYFLIFLDAAYGHNWNASASFPKRAWLMGVGPGFRFQYNPYLFARVDWGFRIHNTSFGNGQYGRFHFSATLSY